MVTLRIPVCSLFAVAALRLLSVTPLAAQNAENIAAILQDRPPEAAARTMPEEAPPAPLPKPLLYLRDGSKVAGSPKLETLDVETRYGLLKIPPAALTRIRFTQRVDPALKAKIDALVKQLGDDDFDRREEAMQELRNIKLPALASLQNAVKAGNEELKDRAEVLVEEFQKLQRKQTSEKDSLPEVEGTEDEVVTERMTIRGRVLVEVLAVDTRYGELTIRVEDLRGISFRPPTATARRLQIGPSYQPPGNWLDTHLTVARGQILKIEAGGSITVSNYGISSGPEGTRQWGGSGYSGFQMLALIGKIGKKGKPFLVGTQHKSTAKKPGKLYLAVVTFTPYPQGTAGSYQVKVKVSGGE